MAVGKIEVRDYNKSDGTRVRRHIRNDPRARGSSEEPNPEDSYTVEATVMGDMDNEGKVENARVTEVKTKLKEEKKEAD
jgi:hypothetical protein